MLLTRLRSFAATVWQTVIVYLLKFGMVGLIGFVVDVTVFNLLRLEVAGVGWWSTALGAKVVSTAIAIVVNWLGNRFWTFRNDRHTHIVREFLEFVVASLLGLAVTLGCLWFTHHVLGLTSLLADNISGNVVGLGLGTAVRFLLYRFWVWRPRPDSGVPNLDAELDAELQEQRVG